MYYVLVLTLKQRKKSAMKLQKILSTHGHLIKTRLCLHESVKEEHEGLIIMHVEKSSESDLLVNQLNSIEDINAKLVKIK